MIQIGVLSRRQQIAAKDMAIRWDKISKETLRGAAISAPVVAVAFIFCCGMLNFRPGIEPAFLASATFGVILGFIVGGVVAFLKALGDPAYRSGQNYEQGSGPHQSDSN